ncbi:RagB/SusD family nutrient uptake outer membrane protein [Mucilaginibacter sp. HMF5004]|uniref:RagB/SusD family nutrient uptake outer membrane protein n=1 Tax=Mucilaginibacter rivuli TaxID=2857527 RepID=UPI001C5CC3C4|nr:RagB/SusD family nutrient uptake outer membrane protein [Mucilaginibacter rivuli]MBW4888532.1 RagB/SusD family nutrient uptake outer membrane protein [Mucilaginibacter rivuli]
MIKKIKFSVLIIITIVCSSSCSKWLETKPVDGRIREDYWKTQEQLRAAVVGCYVSLANSTLVQNMFLWGELRADMISLTPTTTPEEIQYASANILSTSSITKWNTVYSVINNCNTVIQFGPSVLQNDPTLTQAQLNAYLAEAKAMRALMYFYLVRTFGEVPLQLKASSSDSDIQLLAKSSREDVLKVVVDDLTFAEQYAVLNFGTDARLNKGRITRYGVYAIEADVYLWMAGADHPDYYTKCIDACDKVINSGSFGLIDGSSQIDWYTNLYFNGNSNESIFEIQFDSQLLNPFYSMFGDPSKKRFLAAPTLMDQVFTTDPVDPNKIKDIRGDAGSLRATDNVIWKFAGTPAINTIRTQPLSYAHWFFYRYADILLLKAEACAWSSRGQDALDLINAVRKRAGALSGSQQFPSLTDAEDITEYILAERQREFAFEGKRWFDVLRCAKRDNYAHMDLIFPIVGTNAGSGKGLLIQGKYADVRSHYLPINIDELTADKNLVQNPFYQ